MNRRDAFKLTLGAAALVGSPRLLGTVAQAQTQTQGQAAKPFTLPPLGYAYDALEPHIDTKTMTIHHQNHHNAYVNNANALVERYPALASKSAEEIVTNMLVVPIDVRTPVRNNVGGHWNHTFFWDLMTPGGAKQPGGDLKSAIEAAFGDVDKMQQALKRTALGRFGSGWAWLVVKDKKLALLDTPYQDTPHMDHAAQPVIGIDVWEHAYYLKHQSRRGEYVDAWWNVVNWDKAGANFKKAMG